MIRKIFICLFVAFSLAKNHAHAQELLNSDSISHSVNVITGEYCELRQDLPLLMPPHISLQRAYDSSQGWQYLFPQELQSKAIPHTTKKTEDGITIPLRQTSITYMMESPTSSDQLSYLTSVLANKQQLYQYKYIPHPAEETQLLNEWTAGNGTHFIIEYYGCKNSNGDYYKTTSKDPRVGRVKLIRGRINDSNTLAVIARFVYTQGRTDVYDAHDQKKSYFYEDDGRITAIEDYSGSDVYRTERFFWGKHPKTETWLLQSRVWEDGAGVSLACTTYEYDAQGNRCRETLHGNLSGNNKAPLIVDSHGNVTSTGTESYSKTWTYSPGIPALVLTQSEDNGTVIEFEYDKKWRKATGIYLGDGQKILRRWFFDYDSHGSPVMITADNGCTRQRGNDEGVSQQILHSLYLFG